VKKKTGFPFGGSRKKTRPIAVFRQRVL